MSTLVRGHEGTGRRAHLLRLIAWALLAPAAKLAARAVRAAPRRGRSTVSRKAVITNPSVLLTSRQIASIRVLRPSARHAIRVFPYPFVIQAGSATASSTSSRRPAISSSFSTMWVLRSPVSEIGTPPTDRTFSNASSDPLDHTPNELSATRRQCHRPAVLRTAKHPAVCRDRCQPDMPGHRRSAARSPTIRIRLIGRLGRLDPETMARVDRAPQISLGLVTV